MIKKNEPTINEFYRKEAIDTRELVDSLYEIDKTPISEYQWHNEKI